MCTLPSVSPTSSELSAFWQVSWMSQGAMLVGLVGLVGFREFSDRHTTQHNHHIAVKTMPLYAFPCVTLNSLYQGQYVNKQNCNQIDHMLLIWCRPTSFKFCNIRFQPSKEPSMKILKFLSLNPALLRCERVCFLMVKITDIFKRLFGLLTAASVLEPWWRWQWCWILMILQNLDNITEFWPY